MINPSIAKNVTVFAPEILMIIPSSLQGDSPKVFLAVVYNL
jgi:hypothetical protein